MFRRTSMRRAGGILAVACLAGGPCSAIAHDARAATSYVGRSRVLACMRASGWSPVTQEARQDVLAATDRHAEVELRFFGSAAAARRSLPAFVPLGVGWERSVSFVFAGGATLADELALDRCIDG